MKRYNEAQFITALKSGEYDFSGSEFVDPIRIDYESGIDFTKLPRLVLDRCVLGPNFSFGRWENPTASISMINASSKGRVALMHLKLYQINLSGINVSDWLAVMHSEAEIICFAGAEVGGFTTKGSHGGRLDLTSCISKQSLFEATSFRTVEVDDAQLGRLTPTSLGELRTA